jgi:hypothetical protein
VELGIGCDVSRDCITLNADGWQVDGPMKCKLSSDSIPFTIFMTVEYLTSANAESSLQGYADQAFLATSCTSAECNEFLVRSRAYVMPVADTLAVPSNNTVDCLRRVQDFGGNTSMLACWYRHFFVSV